ncbi:50S ribosomal protein L25/general stress protein Ctc [Longispora sp. K20-0274]|uniref:50S ribosomal protein L25/general stress protein Ctc n=1 Tax=Longispora sp. K20-0274 TaxID=3088255 RepID=UPI003999D9C2
MSEVRISAEPRTEFGKGGARRTRRAGKIPAVLYGHGEAPKHIALPALEFTNAIRRGGINQLFTLESTAGEKILALPKALQRDAIKDTIDHVDMLIVKRGEKVTVEVPIHFVGEADKSGMVMHALNTLSLSADATKLPDSIEVSLDGLAVGEHLTAGQITLPEGSELITEPETLIVNVVATPSAADTETEEAPAEA